MAVNPTDVPAVTLADGALAAIQARIVEGDLAPGTKLIEEDLAQAHGVSRGPLREALRRLQARRLVEVVPNIGARVVALHREELQAIYEAREALEGMACRLAAQRIQPSEIDALNELLETHAANLQAHASEPYLQEAGNYDFHYRIAQASGNPVLVSMLCDDLYHVIRMYRRRMDASAGRSEQALHEHQQIVSALAARDGELAELLMRRHVSVARQIFIDDPTDSRTNASDDNGCT